MYSCSTNSFIGPGFNRLEMAYRAKIIHKYKSFFFFLLFCSECDEQNVEKIIKTKITRARARTNKCQRKSSFVLNEGLLSSTSPIVSYLNDLISK